MLPVLILKRLVSVLIKCLSLIAGFAVTVAIWQREVVSCHDFILRAVATLIFGPCRLSEFTLAEPHNIRLLAISLETLEALMCTD